MEPALGAITGHETATPPSDGLPLEPLAPLSFPLPPPVLDPLEPECEPLLAEPLAEPAAAAPLDPLLAPLGLPAEPPDEPLRIPADAAPLEEPLAAPLSLPDATENAWPPHPSRKAPAMGMSGMSRHRAVRLAIVIAPRTRKLIESRGNLAPPNCSPNARAAPPEEPAAPHWEPALAGSAPLSTMR